MSLPPSAAVTATPAKVTVVVRALSALAVPLGTTGSPKTPIESTLAWVALAATRRELGTLGARRGIEDTTSAVAPGQLLNAEAVALPSANGAPTITKTTVGKPSASTGAIAGSVTATDPEKDLLTYTVDSTATTHGTVSIDPAKGKFVYTPTAAARHAAASITALPGDKTDTFTVNVTDADGNVASHTFNVTVAPANATPTGAGAAVGQPNSTTGVVIGTAFANDADLDPLTLAGPASTTKGSIGYDNATGTFTYAPTAAARAAANATNASASAKVDKFTVTLNDGHGGTSNVSVTVNLANVVGQTQFPGAATGTVVTDVTGTKYELVTALNLTATARVSPTRVIVINPDGTAAATVKITGVYDLKGGGLIAAPNGGVYLATVNGTKTQVSVISPTGALTTSGAMAGTPSGPIIVAADGTGYVTVGQFNTTKKTTLSIAQIKPSGLITIRTVSGTAADGVSVATDGTAYQAYQDGAITRVLAIAADGTVRTLSAAAGQTVVGTAVGVGSTVYLTTYDQAADFTSVYLLDGAGISTPRTIAGKAVGEVVIGGGAVYQVTTSTAVPGSNRISVITPTGVITSDPFVGLLGFSGKFTTLQVAADGTGYLLYTNPVTSTGSVAVVRPTGALTTVSVPSGTNAAAIGQLVIGPDNKLYSTSTSDSAYAISPNGTVTVFSNSSGVTDLEFDSTGAPFAAFSDGSNVGYVNLSTGTRSDTIAGTLTPSTFAGTLGDGLDPLTIEPDGSVIVKSYSDTNAGEIRKVTVMLGAADGTTIATFTDTGYGVWLTSAGGGVEYATVYDTATRTTKVWKLSSAGAVKIATVGGLAPGGVDMRPDGKLYLSTSNGTTGSNVKTDLHLLDPASVV